MTSAAMTSTRIATPATREASTGQSPDSSRVFAKSTIDVPNTAPAATARPTAPRDANAAPSSAGSLTTSPAAPMATTTPTPVTTDGRSPVNSPHPTGTTAATTAVMDATTPIRPVDRPW